MTDELLKQRLAGYLDHLEAGIRQGGEFVAGQAPEVAQQLIAYTLAANVALLLGSLAFAGLFAFGFRKSLSLVKESDEFSNAHTMGMFGTILSGSGFVVAMNPLFGSINDILKVWLAPKYFLLERLASLLG